MTRRYREHALSLTRPRECWRPADPSRYNATVTSTTASIKADPSSPPEHGPEALIAEARARQRRRRRGIAVAVVLAAAAGAGTFAAFGGGGAAVSHRPPPTVASPGAIRAFLARAQRAFSGTFSVTYQVSIAPAGHAPARQAEVTAAQRSRAEWLYRETPSFAPFSGGHGYEVVTSRARIFSCAQASASW